MEDLKIYDRDGNEISITDVVYSYIQSKAEQAKLTTEDVYISAYGRNGRAWIETYKDEDNGYDGVNLVDLNISDEVK